MLTPDKLHNHQLTGRDHILDHSHCALFFGMGLGKTVTTLTAINTLMFEELEIRNVLVIAPPRVASIVWPDEIGNWSHLQGLKVMVIEGPPKHRQRILKSGADVYTISRDLVTWLCDEYKYLPFDMLVIDESSSFKNPRSQRFKALRRVAPEFKRVVLLTGTPVPNTYVDLWPQMFLLDRGERLEKTLGKYRGLYFKPGMTNGHVVYNWILKKGADAIINDKIKDVCLSMKTRDYLDLPEFIENDVMIELDPGIMKQYKDFERDLILGDNISAVNNAVLSNKLIQFTGGAVYTDTIPAGIIWQHIHNQKIETVQERIEKGKNVIIAYLYKHERERLIEAFPEARDLDVRAWNNGEMQIMLMQPQSGGHGLNLQKGGSHIIWYSQTWDLELYLQFNARLDRQGQTEPGLIDRLICKGTIDELVVKRRGKKEDMQRALLEAVKAKIKEYSKQNDIKR